ncbi:MAG: sulfur carrier protein ThiS [Verrucomicrobiota bacterium]
MAKVIANGQDVVASRLADFLSEAGWKPTQVVVELNGEVVPKAKVDEIRLNDGDRIEVIVPVAGG